MSQTRTADHERCCTMSRYRAGQIAQARRIESLEAAAQRRFERACARELLGDRD